uniref:Putative transmembrane protein 65 n=1 Tax=Toxoplasma gondii COUG TaxID=1074873 RepID=A0A2G8XRV1_TOXGO|nr:putative transmembrane protein 65 [Toxoplasma gondii COUG]
MPAESTSEDKGDPPVMRDDCKTQQSATEKIPRGESYVDNRTAMLVALWSGAPFLGFGFMDNCLMLLCGDLIDSYLGAFLGVTTLTAAALGNLFSCTSGVVTGRCVEQLAYRTVWFPRVTLNAGQVGSRRALRAHTIGAVAGVCIGCTLGMFPLLFLGIKRKESKQTNDETNTDLSSPLQAVAAPGGGSAVK